MRSLILLLLTLGVSACSTSTSRPENPEDLCAIFQEKSDWYEAAQDMTKKWGTPPQVPMAMMYQESSFRYDAQPPMRYFLFIPLGRPSSAYGFAQV